MHLLLTTALIRVRPACPSAYSGHAGPRFRRKPHLKFIDARVGKTLAPMQESAAPNHDAWSE